MNFQKERANSSLSNIYMVKLYGYIHIKYQPIIGTEKVELIYKQVWRL